MENINNRKINNRKLFLSADEQNKLNLLFLEGSSIRRAVVITNISNAVVTQYFDKLAQAIQNQVKRKTKTVRASITAEYFQRITDTNTMYGSHLASCA